MKYDICIIGAGILGASTAYQLIKKKSDLKILLLEKENSASFHQTGHNSGVIHSGIYYKPGSYKARNCIQGYQLLIDFCLQHNIPFKNIGKLIVANHDWEIPQMESIYQNGVKNGLQGLQILNSEQIKELEPNVTALKAIHVPQAAIINYKTVVEKLLLISQQNFLDIQYNKTVTEINNNISDIRIHCNDGSEYETSFLINCSGLQTDRITKLAGIKIPYKIIPFKGNYYKLIESKKDIVQKLIYPVPDSRFPFLGIHYTRLMNGDQTLGPNAILAFNREGYTPNSYNFNDIQDILNFPGFWKLIFKFWKTGLNEYRRNYSKEYFAKKASEMTKGIVPSDLLYAGSGIRAQLVDRNGALVEDFVNIRTKNMIHICNAPSPAATAGLAIGQQICDSYFADS
ncbi:MAG: L-2-hydroxyglutarate oxidase [Saprospiraceae bacterium]|nr:L-2-hydroxyglutarate oxidase [Saprospiraceae bacterium]